MCWWKNCPINSTGYLLFDERLKLSLNGSLSLIKQYLQEEDRKVTHPIKRLWALDKNPLIAPKQFAVSRLCRCRLSHLSLIGAIKQTHINKVSKSVNFPNQDPNTQNDVICLFLAMSHTLINRRDLFFFVFFWKEKVPTVNRPSGMAGLDNVSSVAAGRRQ